MTSVGYLAPAQRWFVFALGAYFWTSAFGALTLPGVGVSYSNLAFMLLIATLWGQRSRGDWLTALGLLVLMVQDIVFRLFTDEWYGVGYSVNIGRMAIFVLLARPYINLPAGIRANLLIAFGVAAFLSEMYVFYDPSYRMALFNAKSVGEGFGFELYRPTGLIGDPNYFAVPLALMAVSAFQVRRIGWFLFSVVLVLATGSRSAVIAVLLPVMLMQITRVRQSGRTIAAILTSYGVALVLVALLNAFLREGTTSESNAERVGLLMQGMANVLTFSFLGTTYGMPSAVALDGDRLVVHNTYIQTLSTSFFLGLFILYRSIVGLWRKRFSPILLCMVIEMLFLDMSSYSAFLLVFLLYSVPIKSHGIRS